MLRECPTISVIVPTHNEEKFIGRCLRSLIKQSLPQGSYEIIVVNDGSTDATTSVLDLFSDVTQIVTNTEQLGLPASLNRGIRMARGQFIVRVDADDYVHRDYLKVLSLHLQLNNDIDAIACDYLLINEQQDVIAQKNCLEDPIGCGIMFRIDHLISVGLYNEEFIMREEEDLRIRFLENYAIERVRLPLYRYRKHPDNMTNNLAEYDYYAKLLQTTRA